jgi:uncharacterized protein (DUF427 family)
MRQSCTFRGRTSTSQLLREQITKPAVHTKGEASYYAIRTAERISQNAAWSYEQPLQAVAAIAGHMAFYRDRVDGLEQLKD